MPPPNLARKRATQARKFLTDSDAEFAAGDRLQASEKLWGAASQAVLALAAQRGQPCGSHRAMKNLVEQIDDPALTDGFAIAEKFHINFYHDAMEDYQMVYDRPRVHRFVHELLALAETS